MEVPSKAAVEALVRNAVQSFAVGFEARHGAEVDDPEGTLNMKAHNVFIAVLGPEIRYYTALARSFDSSLGNMLEGLAIEIARLFYEVHRHVEGALSLEQTQRIAEILEQYKNRSRRPSVSDYATIRTRAQLGATMTRRHESDYYLIDRQSGERYLIELKAGGDLDNKKARSEKEALLEQLAILSNSVPPEASINLRFATAYNRYGEEKPWLQQRVRQFFADEELLIGRDFWNFVCKSEHGYTWVLDAYRESAHLIRDALDQIKDIYLARGDELERHSPNQYHHEEKAA